MKFSVFAAFFSCVVLSLLQTEAEPAVPGDQTYPADLPNMNQSQPKEIQRSTENTLSNQQILSILEGLTIFAGDSQTSSKRTTFSYENVNELSRDHSVHQSLSVGGENNNDSKFGGNHSFKHTSLGMNRPSDRSDTKIQAHVTVEKVNKEPSQVNASSTYERETGFTQDESKLERPHSEQNTVFITLEEFKKLKKSQDPGTSHERSDKTGAGNSKIGENRVQHEEIQRKYYENARKTRQDQHTAENQTHSINEDLPGEIRQKSEDGAEESHSQTSDQTLEDIQMILQKRSMESYRKEEQRLLEEQQRKLNELIDKQRKVEEGQRLEQTQKILQNKRMESYMEEEQRLLEEQLRKLKELIEKQKKIEADHKLQNEEFLRQQELLILDTPF